MHVERSLMDGANDWRVVADYDHRCAQFPPVIFATNLRPDIVVWSLMARKVVLLELPCCGEEGVDEANARKVSRYTDLVASIPQPWSTTLLTFAAYRSLGLSFSCQQPL